MTLECYLHHDKMTVIKSNVLCTLYGLGSTEQLENENVMYCIKNFNLKCNAIWQCDARKSLCTMYIVLKIFLIHIIFATDAPLN